MPNYNNYQALCSSKVMCVLAFDLEQEKVALNGCARIICQEILDHEPLNPRTVIVVITRYLGCTIFW
jgi:hypothetical protein